MTINILAFGIIKEITGTHSIQFTIEENMNIAQLRAMLETNYPRLKTLSTYMIAQNSHYTSGDEVLCLNDEIALIPPVSGG